MGGGYKSVSLYFEYFPRDIHLTGQWHHKSERMRRGLRMCIQGVSNVEVEKYSSGRHKYLYSRDGSCITIHKSRGVKNNKVYSNF